MLSRSGRRVAERDEEREQTSAGEPRVIRVQRTDRRLGPRVVPFHSGTYDPDHPTALTASEVRAMMRSEWSEDPVAKARSAAHSVYRNEGIPCGHDRWTRGADGITWEPIERFAGGREECFEYELWWHHGRPSGGSAWAAGQVLSSALVVAGLRDIALDAAGRPPEPGQSSHAEMLDYLVRAAEELGGHYQVLLSKIPLPENEGRPAEELMEQALKSIRGPSGRRASWELRFLPVAQAFCAGKGKVSYGKLILEARRWSAGLWPKGENPGLPASDKAIKAGIKRLEKHNGLMRSQGGL